LRDIVFILKVPPPVHGSTMMNKIVAESKQVGFSYSKEYHLESISKNVDDIGKFSLRKIVLIIENYKSLFRKLLNHKPKLVYFAISPKGLAFYKDFISILIVKIFVSKIVYHFHVKGLKQEVENSFLKSILYKISFRNQYGIVLSNSLKNEYESLGFKKLFIVPNGLEDYSLNYKDDRENNFVITFLSNFIREKGVMEFIETLSLLNTENYTYTFNLIGKEGDVSNEEIINKIKDLGLISNMEHFGPAYGDEKFKLLSKSSLFLFPTYYKSECYPLVLIEALQFGVPVISSNEGAISDIVTNGESGFIIDPKNIDSIVEKVKLLYNDKNLQRRMQIEARKSYLSKNSIDKFESKLNNVIVNIMESV